MLVSVRCPWCCGGSWWSVPPSPRCLSPQGRLSPSPAPRWPRWPCAPSSSPWLRPAATARRDGTGRGVPRQLRGSPVLWPWLPPRPPGPPLFLQPPPGHEPLCFSNKPVAEMAVPSVGGGCGDPRVPGGGGGCGMSPVALGTPKGSHHLSGGGSLEIPVPGPGGPRSSSSSHDPGGGCSPPTLAVGTSPSCRARCREEEDGWCLMALDGSFFQEPAAESFYSPGLFFSSELL